jgi:hypothetical protein
MYIYDNISLSSSKNEKCFRQKVFSSVSQPPGRGPVPGPGINYIEPGDACYNIALVKLINNLNIILYLSTCHTVHISVLILFMIMT